MGIRCCCGVATPSTPQALATGVNVKFAGYQGIICGDLRYIADVCVDTPGSSLKLVFTERNHGPRSFSFVANSFNSVICHKDCFNRVVKVSGIGTLVGTSFQRKFAAVFVDQPESTGFDSVQSFVINGFFMQGSVQVPKGSIIAVGCFK